MVGEATRINLIPNQQALESYTVSPSIQHAQPAMQTLLSYFQSPP